MRRSWQIWIAFGLCLAVVLTAMGWISLKALALERAERRARASAVEARREAALEQDVQLALYRMEFALAPLVARESAWPYFVYNTFFSGEGAYGAMGAYGMSAYGAMYGEGPTAEGRTTSPLVAEESPDVLLHFQFGPGGRLTSPRVPGEEERRLLVPEKISPETIRAAETQLARVGELVDREKLMAMLPDQGPESASRVAVPLAAVTGQMALNRGFQEDSRNRGRNVAEFGRRSQAVANTMFTNAGNAPFGEIVLPSTEVGGVPMTPLWAEGRLFLARRVRVGMQEYVQGCLVDWPSIKETLLLAIEDLLPEADLVAVASDTIEEESRRLAAIPVRLIPGPGVAAASSQPALDVEEGFWSPIRLSLLLAWACVLLAAAAGALLVAGVIRLSDRRAAFVSAVTHELRTPLTTFHMYTEMLSEGMVPDEATRQDYLGTLRSEASRLSHLVENVLSYARLERGRADGRVENVALAALLEGITPRLSDHARRDGMEVVVEVDPAASSAVVRANPSAAEQILLNLVDNADKYAGGTADRRIHITAQRSGGAVEVRVRDHGPGVAPSVARRLFRSFGKSAHEAAHSAPGVGLGLALSRRLAYDMGARLTLDKTVTDGACFVLSLAVIGNA